MKTARVGFGCLVDNYGDYFYVVGGSTGKHKATNKCEMYSIEENKWSDIPMLNEAKFSHSLCMFNDEFLFAFGGFGDNHKLSATIERLNITPEKIGTTKWVKLQVSLPANISSAAAFQLNMKQIVICGGWNKESQATAYILQ